MIYLNVLIKIKKSLLTGSLQALGIDKGFMYAFRRRADTAEKRQTIRLLYLLMCFSGVFCLYSYGNRQDTGYFYKVWNNRVKKSIV